MSKTLKRNVDKEREAMKAAAAKLEELKGAGTTSSEADLARGVEADRKKAKAAHNVREALKKPAKG